jgi:hypothetical protein
MDEMTQAINSATTPNVQLWMNWMLVIFALSILFVWKYHSARYVLVAFILSALLGLAVFKLTKEPHLIGIAHIVLWGPLAFYLYFKVMKDKTFKLKSVFGIWLVMLLATILISLVFDIRDIVLVLS